MVCGLLLGWWMACCLPLRAQDPAIPFFPSQRTGGMLPFANLQGEWTDENEQRILVPFNDFERRSLLLYRRFDLVDHAQLPDNVYLYFEGLAWTAEIYLNNRLIACTDDPFAEHLFLLEKSWLQPIANRIELRLARTGPDYPLYPRHFLGVFRQALLLRADPAGPFPARPQEAVGAGKAVVIAPWGHAQKFLHDTLPMAEMLAGPFSVPPGQAIYFPFRPSSQALAMVARMGTPVVPPGPWPDSLGFYNTYPIGEAPALLYTPFWRQENLRPNAGYGQFYTRAQIEAPKVLPLDKTALFVFLLIPVLCMLLLKLFAPRIFDTIPEYLTRTKIYLELIASNKFLKDEQRWALNAVRILLLSLTIALFLYYLRVTGGWSRLNVFSSESFLYRMYAGTDYSLYVLFLQCFGAVTFLTLLKYFILNVVSGIYRVYNLGPQAQNLDIYASFPVNLLPLLPAAVIFFLDAPQGQIALQVWIVFFVVHLLRRVYLIYTGLSRLFQFSASLKILYICTLEISPWIFLL